MLILVCFVLNLGHWSAFPYLWAKLLLMPRCQQFNCLIVEILLVSVSVASQDGNKHWSRDNSHRLVSESLKGRPLAVVRQCAFICFAGGGETYHLQFCVPCTCQPNFYTGQGLGLRLFADTAIIPTLTCLLFVVVNACVACQHKSKDGAWHWDYGRCWCCGFVWCFSGHAHVWHHGAWCSPLANWNHLLFTKLSCFFQ